MALQSLSEGFFDLVYPAIERLLWHLPDTRDFRDLEVDRHLDEQPVVGWKGVESPVEGNTDPPALPGQSLLLQLLVGRELPGRLEPQQLFSDDPPRDPGGELGFEVRELCQGKIDLLVGAEDLAGLVEGIAVPVDELLKPLGHLPQAMGFGGFPPFAPEVIQVVEEEAFDDRGQEGVELGPLPPLVLTDDGVVVLHELDVDPGEEVLLVLRPEPGSLAGVLDDALDEGEALLEELLGVVGRRRGIHGFRVLYKYGAAF